MKWLICLITCCFLLSTGGAQDAPNSPYNNALEAIRITQERNAEYLSLRGFGLTELPPEIGTLTNLERLDLSNNQLRTLPPEISQLENLLYLDVSQNQLEALPPSIGALQKLCWLDVSSNRIRYLPNELVSTDIFEDNSQCPHTSSAGYLSSFLVFGNNPLISPPRSIHYEGNLAIRDYLQNEAAWHFKQLVLASFSVVGLLLMLATAWRLQQFRRKGKKKRG